jgi:hypothetical protein
MRQNTHLLKLDLYGRIYSQNWGSFQGFISKQTHRTEMKKRYRTSVGLECMQFLTQIFFSDIADLPLLTTVIT